MNIDLTDRDKLKGYFVKNAVPTEKNFSELIEAGLNQKEDGIAKLPGDPLAIEAAGGADGQQKVINFYQNFGDSTPSWVMSLNPRETPDQPNSSQPGFSIGDTEGKSRVFVEKSTGRIGIGTVRPAGALDVRAEARTGSHASDRVMYVTGPLGSASGIEFRHSNGTQGIGFGYNTIYATGGHANQDLNINARGTGSVRVGSGLRIDGNRSDHINTDGALYRTGGQVYLTVDDNFYVRDSSGTVSFHFQTDQKYLFGAARDQSKRSVRIATGRTPASATPWQQYSADGIFVDVDTSSAGFQGTPEYFTTLHGGSHWTTTGVTSIYSARNNKFRVYIHQKGITVARAKSLRWCVSWVGIGL